MFHRKDASLFVPDASSADEAFAKTTHLGVVAHADDLEILAFHGIVECFGQEHLHFGGIVCSDGAGSPRRDAPVGSTPWPLKSIRREEQKAAATLGQYAFVAQLDYPSDAIKAATHPDLDEDLLNLLLLIKPRVIYTHNPFDRHATHVAVTRRLVRILSGMPPELRPSLLIGCEVWRSLDWLPSRRRVELDVSGHTALAQDLLRVFQSQITQGKRYDVATLARRRAHATYSNSHRVDDAEELILAIDLLPAITQHEGHLGNFVDEVLSEFTSEVHGLLHPDR